MSSDRISRNIVICCDGTGNEFSDANSNVVKLYATLAINERQIGYYHPGVGTMGAANASGPFQKKLSQIGGMAFGIGFTANLGDAYRYLMDEYRDGDRIFLFGFSRGAYTVRALAGALSVYGLLCKGNEGHLPYLLRMYSQASRKAYNREQKHVEEDAISAAFKEAFARPVPIHFAGIWDTVSSVGWIYDPVKLLFDGQNPIVRRGRHAISIDEHRCFFQDNLWGSPLPPHRTPLLNGEQQDLVQAWFPGVHSDVGGSYAQVECAPAENALRWILHEAEGDGLLTRPDKKNAVFGEHPPGPEPLRAIFPRPLAKLHDLHKSLTWKWLPLEVFPHKYFDINGKKRWQWIPWMHRREIPDGSLLHPSVKDYLENYPGGYRPKNLDRDKIVPLAESPIGPPALPIASVEARLVAEDFSVYRPTRKN